MQSGSLNDFLFGKYILCVCEGIAEESIIDLLLDNNKLCFKQDIEIKNQAETEIEHLYSIIDTISPKQFK